MGDFFYFYEMGYCKKILLKYILWRETYTLHHMQRKYALCNGGDENDISICRLHISLDAFCLSHLLTENCGRIRVSRC